MKSPSADLESIAGEDPSVASDAVATKAPLVLGEGGAGPDFICVGLQKAGTQWLYDQVQNHEDFWMPPRKEIHFFDRRFPDYKMEKAARNFANRPEKMAAGRARRGDAPIDERGADFFRQVANFNSEQNDLESYAMLFRSKGDKISGDVTPAYCSLDPEIMQSIATRFPMLKICLMLREPAARLWSQWRMEKLMGTFKTFEDYIEDRKVLKRSYPSEISRFWREAFGDRYQFFFLDDVISRPAEVRAELIAFVGGDPAKPSNVQPDFNRKARSKPLKRSKKAQRLMRELFEEERLRCAEIFGGPAKHWPSAPY